jgi:RNA polymerase sigma factor (sigma-70 family)
LKGLPVLNAEGVLRKTASNESADTMSSVEQLLCESEQLLRELTPQVLGTVVRKFHDFAAAEDAVQEASLAAAMQWPIQGLPNNPRAWLTQVAFRRLIDEIRRDSARRTRENELICESAVEPNVDFAPNDDDTLVLLFMCCHPSLTQSSAIALTLRAVGGLTTAEIAHAFLVPEATMAQRISRAKQTIKSSGIPFQLPTLDERTQRLKSVLHVLYLIFNEGYTSSGGSALHRTDLSQEAIRLTRIVRELQPHDTEVAGLLALMLLTDARRRARTTPEGYLAPLSRQDRKLWNKDQIAEGVALISETLPKGVVGAYQLQAAIAAVHDEAASAEETDWPQILALYDVLQRVSDNPMVKLNGAVAAAMVHGPAKGLQLLEELANDARVANHHRLHAVRAHLLELGGDFVGAIEQYRSAAARTGSLPERNYLLTQAAQLERQVDADQTQKITTD